MANRLVTPLARSRFRGCLIGLAVGDALGTSVEFKPPGSFKPLSDMVGGGPFHLKPGEWTDDTSMALCLADSLIEKADFDPIDQLERYVRWYRTGYLSSNGYCFDIGNTIRDALLRFEQTWEAFPGSKDPQAAGSGSLMRLAPVPMFYARQPQLALEKCGDSSRTTHACTQAVDACRYYGMLILGALNGWSKEELLSTPAEWVSADEGVREALTSLEPAISEVSNGSFKKKQPPDIQGSGYGVRGMEAALWAFYHSASYREGALRAANLGDDADTTAAIYGQLAGAYYGEDGIPVEWRSKLVMANTITDYANKLWEAGK